MKKRKEDSIFNIFVKREIKSKFGSSFAKQFQIRCLDNISHMIFKSGVFNQDDNISLSRLSKTNHLAKALLNKVYNFIYLSSLFYNLKIRRFTYLY